MPHGDDPALCSQRAAGALLPLAAIRSCIHVMMLACRWFFKCQNAPPARDNNNKCDGFVAWALERPAGQGAGPAAAAPMSTATTCAGPYLQPRPSKAEHEAKRCKYCHERPELLEVTLNNGNRGRCFYKWCAVSLM